MCKHIILLFAFILLAKETTCACTFPASFSGSWITGTDGTWTVNSTTIENFPTVSLTTGNPITTGKSALNFNCFANTVNTTVYILESTEDVQVFTSLIRIYICIDLREISLYTYVYYIATAQDPNGYTLTALSTYADACSDTTYEQAYNHRVALLSGQETSAVIQCPSSVFGQYTYNTCSDPASTTTSVSTCDTRTQFVYNYTLCNTTQMFSAEGVLDCIYFEETSLITYMTVYNRDNTTDESTTYRFSCLALSESSGTVTLTVNPKACASNQSPASITSPGVAMTLEPIYLCPITSAFTEESTFDYLPIIIALCILVIIILLIILICCCMRRKRRKKKQEDEEKQLAEEEQQPARADSRRASKGSSIDDEQKSVDSGISEPPPSGRTTQRGRDDDDEDNGQELVITADGEKDVDDKTSRPPSGQDHEVHGQTSEDEEDVTPVENVNDITEEQHEEKQQEKEESVPSEDDVNDETDDDDQAEESDGEQSNDDHDKTDSDTVVVVQQTAEETENDTVIVVQQTGDDNAEETENETIPDDKETAPDEPTNDSKDHDDDTEETHEHVEQTETLEDKVTADKEAEAERTEKESIHEQDENLHGGVMGDIIEEEDAVSEDRKDDQGEEEEREGEEERRSEAHPHSDTDMEGEETAIKRAQTEDKTESDIERERRLIGGKRAKDYMPAGALTTVLVTREEDERKRQKSQGKSKKQKMKKLVKRKTRKYGDKGRKGDDGTDDDVTSSSDEETRQARGLADAPYLEQYNNKKRLEHILDEQHYWSDPEKEDFAVDNISSVFGSEQQSGSESGSEYEDIPGPDGIIIRVKKAGVDGRNKRHGGEGDIDGETEYERKKRMKLAGSLESLTSVENPDKLDRRNSKRKLNEHLISQSGHKLDGNKAGASDNEQFDNIDENGTIIAGDNDKLKGKLVQGGKGKGVQAKTIQVKGAIGHDPGVVDEDSAFVSGKGTRSRSGRVKHTEDGEVLSVFCDTDLDKLSDRDSGLDDDEDEAVDVVLTHEQQQMIVNMLFDEDMNLRPHFGRNEDGKIVRLLDNSVIYDPHTGRFTFRKKLGQLFKVPRLKRNDQGRPTGELANSADTDHTGYVNDEFGPKEIEKRQRSGTSKSKRTLSSKSTKSGGPGFRTGSSKSVSSEMKRGQRGDGKNVGFSVPDDDDVDTISIGQLDDRKRGRRDFGSAIRRKLNKRLFRKKKQRPGPAITGSLPDVQLRKTWTGDMPEPFHVTRDRGGGFGEASPMAPRHHTAPGYQRRHPGTTDPEQLQIYREGMKSDRRILEGLQGRPGGPVDAWESDGEADISDRLQDEDGQDHTDPNRPPFHTGRTYYSEDGRLVIRERGCPEMQPKKAPLFTIVRRPGDLDRDEATETDRSQSNGGRASKSAPLRIQDVIGDDTATDGQGHGRRPEVGPGHRSLDGSYSQMSSIDNNRLRRLLEELYKDKLYFDRYVDITEPKSEAIVHSKGLAEHGRDYLLERADYWERRGPLPKRPPMTEVGWKMYRQQTIWESRQNSELGSTVPPTCTPDIANLPGFIEIESPREDRHSSSSGINSPTDLNESKA